MAEFPISIIRLLQELVDPVAAALNGKLYTKDIAGVIELFYRASNGVIYQVTPPNTSTSIVYWGNNSISSTTTTRYLSPGFDQTLAQTSALVFRIPRSGTFRNMYVLHNTPAGNGSPIVYTLRVNGAPSALAVSIASTATTAQNAVNSVAVAAGDEIGIEVTKAASIGASPTDATLSVQYI